MCQQEQNVCGSIQNDFQSVVRLYCVFIEDLPKCMPCLLAITGLVPSAFWPHTILAYYMLLHEMYSPHSFLQMQSRSYISNGVEKICPMIDLCNHEQHAAGVEG